VERALSGGGCAIYTRPFVAERPQSNPDLTPGPTVGWRWAASSGSME